MRSSRYGGRSSRYGGRSSRYGVRSPGTEYHEDVEDVIATIAAGAPPIYLTNHALTQSGATALFKVYVILDTGNERGSNVATVSRP